MRWLRAVMRASIIVPLVLLGAAAIQSYVEVDRNADERIDRDVRVVQEHALKVLETAASVAGRIDDLASAEPNMVSHANEAVLHQKFNDISTAMPQLLSVWLTDEQGSAIASDRYYPVPVGSSLASRAFFQAQRRDNIPLVLSGVLRGAMSGMNFFSLSRRRDGPDGQFLGVVSVGLSEKYFSDFYSSIRGPDEDLAVALIRDDGTPLVTFPSPTVNTGKLANSNPVMQAMRESGIAKNHIHTGLDGMRRLVAVRKVGNYPVYVAVGALRSTVFAHWRSRMAIIVAFVLPTTLAMVLLCWTALRKVGREHQALAQWRDEVTRRTTAEEALMRAQKMDAIGQMTGGVAHDFNNMLQIISSNVHIIRLKLPDAGVDQQLAAIDRARLSGESLTRQLLAFSRQQALRPEAVDIALRMSSVCELIRHSLGPDIQLECETEPGTWLIEVDPSQLDLALFNLAINARDAMTGGGKISLRAHNVSAAERGETSTELRGDFVAILVEDTGHGVPAEIADRIFEPFFTTKDVGKGTGLGLSQVFGFATQSGGTLTLKSKEGEGTTLTIYLPRSHMQSARRVAADANESRPSAEGRLLVVEDNIEVGDGLAELLGQVGFAVTLKRSAAEAVATLASGQSFDLLLTDLVMPGNFNGLQLARQVMRDYPDLPVVLMTGYSSEVRKASAEGFTILIKPFQMNALLEAIHQRLGGKISGKVDGKAGRAQKI